MRMKNNLRYNECIRILNFHNIDYEIYFYKNNVNKFSVKLLNLINSLISGNPDFFFPIIINLNMKLKIN